MQQVVEFRCDSTFDVSRSTQENYSCNNQANAHAGEFADIRKSIDSRWHGCYCQRRELFQDAIVNMVVPFNSSPTPEFKKLLLFSSGPMGAGKSYSVRWMIKSRLIPDNLLSVRIDPDWIRRRLPEWPLYVQNNASTAGTLTHLESTMIGEIAREVALRRGLSIWVDGSLANTEWTLGDIASVRCRFPEYSICVLHIVADESRILERCEIRARATGRAVPEVHIKRTIEGSAETIRHLRPPLVDFLAVIRNDDIDPSVVRIVSRGGETKSNWDTIRDYFSSLKI